MVPESHVPLADIAPCAPDTADVIRRIAHDLRKPLHSIRQLAYYLDMALPAADSKSRKRLLALQRQVLQARWILEDAALSVDTAPPRFTLVDLKEVVSQALLVWQIEDSAWLCVDYEPELPLVRIDVAQIEQLVRRLVLFFAADARRATLLRCCAAGPLVALEITPPHEAEIPPALAESAESDGSLLAASRRIIDAHGARIEAARSSSGRTTFRILFPAADA